MTTTQQMEIQASHLLKCERVSTLGLRTCCADRKNMIQEAKSHRRRRFCMDFACNGSARLNCYYASAASPPIEPPIQQKTLAIGLYRPVSGALLLTYKPLFMMF